jgi:hypothetical protein
MILLLSFSQTHFVRNAYSQLAGLEPFRLTSFIEGLSVPLKSYPMLNYASSLTLELNRLPSGSGGGLIPALSRVLGSIYPHHYHDGYACAFARLTRSLRRYLAQQNRNPRSWPPSWTTYSPDYWKSAYIPYGVPTLQVRNII